MKSSELVRAALLASSLTFASHSAHALVIGHFDGSRELYGFSTGYLSGATQWLVGAGHTLVSTNNVNAAFLSGVDAFYTGLIRTVSSEEISSFQNFVNRDGGFLFIQQDHGGGPWHSPSNQILSSWGIQSAPVTLFNDYRHTTAGDSEWVTYPNSVTGFSGKAHTFVRNVPIGFETIAVSDIASTIIGVFDAGGGRSSDVLVATDIDFWSDYVGWNDIRNRRLWENIWTTATIQLETPTQPVSEPGTLTLFGIGLSLVGWVRRRAAKADAR